MNATSKTGMKPAREEIAARAYQLWEKDGRKAGQDAKYWLQAEHELSGARPAANPATLPPSAKAAPSPSLKPTAKRPRAQAH